MAMTVSRPLPEKHIRNGRRVTVHRRTRPTIPTPGVETGEDDESLSSVYTLTAVESAEMFDHDARREFGISGREFLRARVSATLGDRLLCRRLRH